MLFQKKFSLFVDGSNAYHLMRRVLPKGTSIQRLNFRKLIARVLHTNADMSRFYYVGVLTPSDDAHAQKLFRNQQRLFTKLCDLDQRFSIRKGQLVKIGDHYREKGVDVRLAIDIVLGVINNDFDVAIILSSDADLLPAVEFARLKGKEVVYLCFEQARSVALTKRSSRTVVIKASDILTCIDI